MDDPSVDKVPGERALLKTVDEKALTALQQFEFPPDAFDHLLPAEKLGWPSRKVLRRELFLTTDNAFKAKYLTNIYEILKKRKSFKHHKDSPANIAADWRMLAKELFSHAFQTLEYKKLHKATETAWFRCFDKQAVKKHASAKLHNCYFFFSTGQWLLLFQGSPEGPKEIREFDMSDREDRRALVTVIPDTMKFNPPKPKSKVFAPKNTDGLAVKKETKKPLKLKRNDLSGVLGKNSPAPRISVERYRKRQKERMARKKTALAQVMYADVDVDMETEEGWEIVNDVDM